MRKALIAANLQLKRAYESLSATDGKSVLIDRLWPRGVKKADAAIDYWFKELAPSTELRKWFGHDPARWGRFSPSILGRSCGYTSNRLIICATWRGTEGHTRYSAHDELHNDAIVLGDFLLDRA